MLYKDLKIFLKKSIIPIILIIIFLLFTYGERIISNAYSIDTELYITNYIENASWWNSLGRWGLTLINKVFCIGPLSIFHSNFFMLVFLILSSIFYNFLIYLYLDDNQKKYFLKYQFIFPIIFYTNPIFAEQFNFTNQNFAVSLCLMLIPLILISLFYLDKIENKLNKYCLIIINITISTLIFATYQSLILLFIANIAVIYFIKCFTENDSNFKWLMKYIILFLTSAVFYFLICKLVGEGNSYLQTGYSSGLKTVFRNIYYVIISTLKCETIFYNISYLFAITFAFFIIAILIKEKRFNIGTLLGTIGMALSPYYIMIITGVDQLKRTQFNYSFIIGITFIIIILLLSKYNNKIIKIINFTIILLGTAIAYKQGMMTALLFSGDRVRFDYDRAFATTLINKIEEKDWYDKNKKYNLILVGKESMSSKLQPLKGEVIGFSFFEFDYPYFYGPSHRATTFINELGYSNIKNPDKNNLKTDFEKAKKYIKENNIKSFPSDESIIKKDEDTIIIRLSDKID